MVHEGVSETGDLGGRAGVGEGMGMGRMTA